MIRRKGSSSMTMSSSNAHGSNGRTRSWHFVALLVVCAVSLTWNWVGPASSSSVYLFGGGGGGGGGGNDSSSRMTTMHHDPHQPPLRGGESSNNIADAAGASTAAAGTATAPYVQHKNSLAYQQSFGFFDNLDDFDWRIRMNRAKNHKHQASPDHKKATTDTDVNRWYLANYYPLFTCPHQERVGSGGDGAKWVCDPWRLRHVLDQPVRNGAADKPNSGAVSSAAPTMLRRDLPNRSGKCLIYSVGCHGNYVFEDGIVEMLGAGTCEIHVFDLAQDYTREGDAANKNIHFHHWGLSSSYSTLGKSKQYSYLTLQQTMEKLGHVNRTIDVFKIDCEHCTWLWVGGCRFS
jgi:Methyltransferase domain